MENKIEKIEKATLKDSPHFLIITSIFIPIFVSCVGLIGILLPKVIDKITPETSSAATNPTNSQGPLSYNGATSLSSSSSSPTTITTGYLTADKLVDYITNKNYLFTLNPTKQPNSFQIQKVGDQYYLVGSSNDIGNLYDIFLVPSGTKDYPKNYKINFHDIQSISISASKDKRDRVSGLSISTTKIEPIN